MKISQQFAGNYFKASDLPQPRVLTIQTVNQTQMPEGDSKPVMFFVGEQQRLVLNKTNAFACVELFGDETSAWHGQQVELYATTTNFSGRMVPCIRVRKPQQAVPQQPTQQQQPAPQPVQPQMPQPAPQPPVQAPAADYPIDA